MNKLSRFFWISAGLAAFLIFSSPGCAHKSPPDLTPAALPQNEADPLPVIEAPVVEEAAVEQETGKSEESTGDQAAPRDEADPPPDPKQALDEALNAYQEACLAWDHGELDAAIAALDETYQLIVSVDLPAESPLVQEKSDLRLLVAQRIQEIYASRATAIGVNHNSIPLVENKWVERELKSFTGVEKKSFQQAYQRSGLYRPMILEELRREGLPEELSWMPMIESWFKIRAYSRARALGLWQFISSTGYRYGLKRDRYIDERMNPLKATRAAVKYLKDLHSWFGDWTTALAGYNCGESRVQRVIKAQRVEYMDNFWDLYVMLPRETARFVPRFIATLLIVNNPSKYGMELPAPALPTRTTAISINKPIQLSTLSQKLGLSTETLADLNPELRHKSTPDQEYQLLVPAASTDQAVELAANLPRWIPPEATYAIHYVRRGETVSGIASRYRTTVSSIARLNNLNRRFLIRPGQRLKVPSRYAGARASSAQTRELAKQGDNLIYTVRRGDSLYIIANAFRTTVQKLKTINRLSSDKLAIGQKLIIQSGVPAGTSLHTVQSGDTPYKIARRYGMSLDALLALNGLTRRSKIYPGQQLRVTPNGNG